MNLLQFVGERVLWDRAQRYVDKYTPTLIGVTGSYGKTLTKEAIALALKDSRHVRASHKNYNTPMGVALSVLGVHAAATRMGWLKLLTSSKVREVGEQREPDTIVLELGADRPGDIDFLAQQLPFKVGVVTAVGSTHLEFFTSKEMVAHEKMSLVVTLPADGVAVLNVDDPLVAQMAEHTKARVITFGESPQANVRLVRATRTGIQGFAVEIAVHGKSHEVSVPHVVGRHQLMSILAALAVAEALEIPIRTALQNVRQLKAPAGRMRVFAGRNRSTIIDDSYNASPESMQAALKTFATLEARRKIAILGDMLELGSQSIQWHAAVGEQVADIAGVFVAVGQQMKHAQAAALEQSLPIDTHHFEDSRDVGKWIADHLAPGDLVLIKGSRGMHMEQVVERLLAEPKEDKLQLVR